MGDPTAGGADGPELSEVVAVPSLWKGVAASRPTLGTVKFSRRVADLADEKRHAETRPSRSCGSPKGTAVSNAFLVLR